MDVTDITDFSLWFVDGHELVGTVGTGRIEI